MHFLQITHLVSLESAASSLSAAFVAGLWQGIALALLTAGLLHFLPKTTATVRFSIWSAVFAASAVLPFLHLAAANTKGAVATNHLSVDGRWCYIFPVIWLSSALYRLVVLVAEAISLRSIWHSAEPISADVLHQAGLQATVAERRVVICTTSEVDRPSVIGFLAPRILIPTWLFAELSETELRHIILHEVEHLRRRDDWLNLLQKVGLVIFPLNPAMFWIDSRLATEREIACDDGVLALTKSPRAYASSLTSIAERRLNFTVSRRFVALALGALGVEPLLRRRPEISIRIESILSQRPTRRPAVAALLLAGIVIGTAVMAHEPDLVTFRSRTAPSETAVYSTPDRVLPTSREVSSTASFRAASFHPAMQSSPTSVKLQKKLSHPRVRMLSAVATSPAADQSMPVHRTVARRSGRSENQWMVLTSWKQAPAQQAVHTMSQADAETQQGTDAVVPVSRLIVRTPDGKFFLAPYAAMPIQAGWLIFQL